MEKGEKKRDRRKYALIGLAVAGGLMLLMGGLTGGGSRESPEPAYTDVGFYTGYLEERITSLCLEIDGVEEAEVFLTLDCSSEYIYRDDGASDFLILADSDGEAAVMLCEIYPRVRGIAVVCTGGDLPRIRETVTELLCAALDLPTNRIRVAGGKS